MPDVPSKRDGETASCMVLYMLFIDFVTKLWKFSIYSARKINCKRWNFIHLTSDPPFLMKTAMLLYLTLFKENWNWIWNRVALRDQLTLRRNTFGCFLKDLQQTLQICRTSGHRHRSDVPGQDSWAAKTNCLRYLRHIPSVFDLASHRVHPCDVIEINQAVDNRAHGDSLWPSNPASFSNGLPIVLKTRTVTYTRPTCNLKYK